jgi:hypothetical protein
MHCRRTAGAAKTHFSILPRTWRTQLLAAFGPSQQFVRIGADRSRDGDELSGVEQSLAVFVRQDEISGQAEPNRQIRRREAGVLAGFHQQAQCGLVEVGVERRPFARSSLKMTRKAPRQQTHKYWREGALGVHSATFSPGRAQRIRIRRLMSQMGGKPTIKFASPAAETLKAVNLLALRPPAGLR